MKIEIINDNCCGDKIYVVKEIRRFLEISLSEAMFIYNKIIDGNSVILNSNIYSTITDLDKLYVFSENIKLCGFSVKNITSEKEKNKDTIDNLKKLIIDSINNDNFSVTQILLNALVSI